MNKPIAIALALASLLATAARAGYILKWTIPVSRPVGSVFIGGAPCDFIDANSDGVADVLVQDSSQFSFYNGATHQAFWSIPKPPAYCNRQSGIVVSQVPNLGGTGDTEILLSCLRYTVPGYQYFSCFLIYNCVTHALEFSSPEEPTSFRATPVWDIDGDGLPEVEWGSTDTLNPVFWIYGWHSSGTEERQPVTGPRSNLRARPSPTAATVTIPCSGPGPINIYAVTGSLVCQLSPSPGQTALPWNCLSASGTPLPAGIYRFVQDKVSGQFVVVR